MSTKMLRTVAATTIALPVLLAVAPAASAATPLPQPASAASTRTATPIGGSVSLCFPMGSVVFCL